MVNLLIKKSNLLANVRNALILVAVILSLSGCYYFDAIKGHIEMTNNKEPLAIAVKQPEYQKYADLLQEVISIKEFAIQEVLLKDSKSYNKYYHTEKKGITHVLTASYPTEFKAYEWRYFWVGKLPFRGFFTEQLFDEEKDELLKQGLDVWDFHSTAYSTLGFFDDPITTPMLKSGIIGVSEAVIHEMVHETFYVNNEGDFNENLASFVAQKATNQYIKLHHPSLLAQLTAKPDPRRKKVNDLFVNVKDELQAIYQSPITKEDKLAKKSEIIDKAAQEIARIYPKSSVRYRTINNARLLQIRRYASVSDYNLTDLWKNSDQSWALFWENLNQNSDAIIAQGKNAN
ncbi:MAG: aminopeptidase [SAR324 cluster bacterium]|nr:aminopeptidase [SAR324 cluster bacterium]